MAISFRPRGSFSLTAAAKFAEGFPGTIAEHEKGDGLRFAWAVDDDWRTAQVTLRQTAETVRGELAGVSEEAAPRARADVERILSLDVEGDSFATLGRRDPVVGALQRRYPGLRPVLFYTPYEAAAWAIIGHRIQMTQAARIRERLALEHGTRGAFPAPGKLRRLAGRQRGLTEQKLDRLRSIAGAALDGRLSRTKLRSLGAEAALEHLQELPGIGPFSAELIWIRGVGDPDRMPAHESRLAGAIRAAYELEDGAELDAVSDGWRPYRAWGALLLRQWLADGADPLADPSPNPLPTRRRT